MMHLKKAIRMGINAIGYDICRAPNKERINDMDLYYGIWGQEAVESRRFYNVGAGGVGIRLGQTLIIEVSGTGMC